MHVSDCEYAFRWLGSALRPDLAVWNACITQYCNIYGIASVNEELFMRYVQDCHSCQLYSVLPRLTPLTAMYIHIYLRIFVM